MKTVCDFNACAGCMACLDVCDVKAITIKDTLDAYNAVISQEQCIDCGACHRVCPNNHPVQASAPSDWYQGWAEDEQIRGNGSSGGAAGAIALAFAQAGGLVCSCVLSSGKFVFQLTDTQEGVKRFAGSKYVKSNPKGIYRAVRERLRDGRRVLFIGLPCQVAGMINFLRREERQRLYTADLICHGTPSPALLTSFLQQYQMDLSQKKTILFRLREKWQIFLDGKSVITNGVSDRYLIAYLQSFMYTDYCYRCQYAKLERIGDLTLGDSWGTTLPAKEMRSGISLILCQTEKGKELLHQTKLHLEDVDLDRAVQNNEQLQCPSKIKKVRKKFFAGLERGMDFNAIVQCTSRMPCFRQDIKETLIRLKIIRRSGKKGRVI